MFFYLFHDNFNHFSRLNRLHNENLVPLRIKNVQEIEFFEQKIVNFGGMEFLSRIIKIISQKTVHVKIKTMAIIRL